MDACAAAAAAPPPASAAGTQKSAAAHAVAASARVDCAAAAEPPNSSASPAAGVGGEAGTPARAHLSIEDGAPSPAAAQPPPGGSPAGAARGARSPAAARESPARGPPLRLPELIVQNDGPVLRKVRHRRPCCPTCMHLYAPCSVRESRLYHIGLWSCSSTTLAQAQ